MRRLSTVCKASSPASTSFVKRLASTHLSSIAEHPSYLDTKVQHAALRGKPLHSNNYPEGCNIGAACNSVSLSNGATPELHTYLSSILARKDWFLLLNHELKARRIVLDTRFVVRILQNQQCPLLSLKFYLWVTNREPWLAKDRTVKNVLSSLMYRLGPLVLSPQVISEARNSGYLISEELLCVLIGSWGRLGLAKYCDEVFGQISFLRISPSTRLYNAVIDALIKANSLDMAYLKFQQMPSDNCKPDRFTYNILIHGVCRIGVVDEALRLMKQMEVSGHRPNVFTYTILIDGFCRANRLKDAITLLDIMKQRNVSFNPATVRSFVNGAFQCAPSQEAFEVVIRFIEKEKMFQNLACGTLLDCLSSRSMTNEVGALFKTLLKRGYTPQNSVADLAISCLIRGGDLSKTCEMVDMCNQNNVRLSFNTYIILIEALYRVKKTAEADRYVSQISQSNHLVSVFSYNMIIDCFCKGNLMNRAMTALNEMLHKCIAPSIVTFNTLIYGYCKNGDMEKTVEMVDMLFKYGFNPDIYTFSALIDGLFRARKIQDACGCFREMKAWGIRPNSVIYNTMIRGLCSTGNVQRCMRLMREMERNEIKADGFSFNALTQAFCRMGNLEKARKFSCKGSKVQFG